jgi:hypothetical protein
MNNVMYYERYPSNILCVSITLTVLSYAVGTLIFCLINGLLGVGYVALCFLSLILGIKFRCCFCYYYGERCSVGLGTLAKSLFKKGKPKEFQNPRNLMPAALLSFTVLFLPLFGALFLLVTGFSWLNLSLLAAYLLIAVIPGFVLRKNLICKYCKQGELGCPAYEGMQGKKSQ